MTKIAIDAREWSTSTGRYVNSLVRNLEKLDSKNQYDILLKPEDMDSWEPTSSNFQKAACGYKEFSFSEQLGFKRQLDKLKVDLVHFPMTQQPARYQGKVVTTINDLTTTRFTNPSKNRLGFWLKQRVYIWLTRHVAKKSEALITYSQFVKDDVVQFAKISPEKVTVIPLAADPIKDEPEPLHALDGKRFIMYVGRPLPHKNLERLIEAFVKIKATHPDVVLVLAGKKDSIYRQIQSDVARRTIKNVVFTDFVTEGRLRWLYENCSAYIFPSLSEGFGLPGLEAMIHGAPVVSSNATCLPEVYGDAAHYFDPTDIQGMADAINEVLTDKDLRQDLIKKGREQTVKYSWQRTAEQTLDVYKQVLAEG
jgi:glycosyltransferase involved in cell wall biosynthesis